MPGCQPEMLCFGKPWVRMLVPLDHLIVYIFSVKRNQWPPLLQALLRRALPPRVYLRYIGRHEEGSLAIWRELATKVATNRAILDIGAYRGVYALAARAVNPRVAIYAFEPNPLSQVTLRCALEGKGITLERVAVAEQPGIVSFICEGETSRIAANGDARVAAVGLDDWVADKACRPALLKIDTEGAEAGILRGAQETIREWQPTILCEVLSDEAGTRVKAALPSYRYFRIDEDHGAEERGEITREDWRHKNWLFVPR